MKRHCAGLAVLLLGSMLVACAAPPPSRPAGSQSLPAVPGEGAASSSASRTLIIAARYEVTDLAAKTLSGGPSGYTKRLFNAGLAMLDHAAAPRPYLAETLPQLNTDSWRVSADGRMETTYRLRPNLVWQ